MSATAICVDGGAVIRTGINEFDFGAEFFENLPVDGGSGAVGTVHTDNETGKVGDFEVI